MVACSAVKPPIVGQIAKPDCRCIILEPLAILFLIKVACDPPHQRGVIELKIGSVPAEDAGEGQLKTLPVDATSTVDEDLCLACEDCLEYCQFDALSMEFTVQVDQLRCVGCGVCVQACPENALILVRRPETEVLPVPTSKSDWMQQRAASRHLNLEDVL